MGERWVWKRLEGGAERCRKDVNMGDIRACDEDMHMLARTFDRGLHIFCFFPPCSELAAGRF